MLWNAKQAWKDSSASAVGTAIIAIGILCSVCGSRGRPKAAGFRGAYFSPPLM